MMQHIDHKPENKLLETFYARAILAGLQGLSNVYSGTVPEGEIRHRRVVAKRARAARKITRRNQR